LAICQAACFITLFKFWTNAIISEKISADKSGANAAGLNSFNENYESDIELRQINFLNKIVEQDHRRLRQRIRPMLGLNTFMSGAKIISGIKLMIKIKKGQIDSSGSTPFEWFYALAGSLRPGSNPYER
jgi:transposase-like protein